MNVIISELPGDVTREEIMEILKEHGVPVTDITLSDEGDSERVAAAVSLDTNPAGAEALANMVNGKFWRGRTLKARAMTVFTGAGLNKK